MIHYDFGIRIACIEAMRLFHDRNFVGRGNDLLVGVDVYRIDVYQAVDNGINREARRTVDL